MPATTADESFGHFAPSLPGRGARSIINALMRGVAGATGPRRQARGALSRALETVEKVVKKSGNVDRDDDGNKSCGGNQTLEACLD